MSTQDLQWLLTRKTSSHIVKQKGLGRIFSREPGNLMNLHSYKYGWVNDKAVGISPAANGRGVVVTTKKSKLPTNKIAVSRSTQTINKGGSRRTAGAVADIVAKRGYRADLLKGEFYISNTTKKKE
jgi:large subunit ribosomal protein L28e